MKNLYVFAISLLVIASACSKKSNSATDQPEGGYLITIALDGNTDSVATLNRPVGRELMPLDTAVFVDGKFYFSGKADEEELLYVQIGKGANYVDLFLENEKINVTSNKDNKQENVVEGGVNNKVWAAFKADNKGFQDALNAMNAKWQAASEEDKKKIEAEFDVMSKAFVAKEVKAISASPKAFASLFILQNILRNQLSFDEQKTAFAALDTCLQGKTLYKEGKESLSILENVQIGKKAPDFTMNDIKGAAVSLSSLEGKGYLLLDFWAGWCKPCRAENPNVLAVYNKFKSKGFSVVGVSLDRNKEEWEAAVKEDKLPWLQLSDILFWESPVVKMYGIHSIPHNLLLDKDGVIVATDLRGPELEAKVAELCGK